jgi:hypothetical protein
MRSAAGESFPGRRRAGCVEAMRPLSDQVRRWVLAVAGTVFVILGLVGVIVPVLPTTPFLLLAAACYLRSSERLHRWLLGNRIVGEYLRRYRDGDGMSARHKASTIVLLWVGLGASALFAVPADMAGIKLLLVIVGVGVTVHLLRIKTLRSE